MKLKFVRCSFMMISFLFPLNREVQLDLYNECIRKWVKHITILDCDIIEWLPNQRKTINVGSLDLLNLFKTFYLLCW